VPVEDSNWAGVVECTVEMPRSGVAVASPWDGPRFKARWVGRASTHRSGRDWGGGKATAPEGYGATPVGLCKLNSVDT
jgi:hypothetical protein